MKKAFSFLSAALIAAQFSHAATATEQLLAISGKNEKPALILPGAPKQAVELLPESLQPQEKRYWITVIAPTKYDRTALVRSGMDLIEINGETASGFVNESTLATFKSARAKITETIPFEIFAAKFIKDFPPGDAVYHNYAETYEALKAIEAEMPEYAKVFSVGRTVEGRDIWCIRFFRAPQPGEPAAKPGAAFIGEHHAREHLSAEVPLAYAQWLADNKDRADVKKILDTRDIYIIPLLNADGAEFDIADGSYQWWRKNRKKNNSASYGVDLNRNYGYLWGGGSSRPDEETYQGLYAFSEPETQAVRAFFDTYTDIRVMISYHSYGRVLLYPWSGTDAPIADAQDLATHKALARQMSQFTGYVVKQSSDLYLSTGDTCDWTYMRHKIFSFTFELEPSQSAHGGFYPGAAIIPTVAANNIKAAFYLTQMADNPHKAAEAQ